MNKNISKIRPDNLDFIFGVNNIEQYFIPSLVLVQSILENNVWANQIQISIFYENWSPEQKNAFEQLVDNFNKSQGKNFAILNLFDVTKLEFETQIPHHGFNNTFRIEGIKYIIPISNWIFSIEANELNIRSLKPLINQLNQDFAEDWAIRLNRPLKGLNFFDGSYRDYFHGPIFIFNTKYLFQKHGILEKYISTTKKIQNTYPEFYGKTHCLTNHEDVLAIALQNVPVGALKLCDDNRLSLDQIPDSVYFLKYMSLSLAPWYKEFPDNSLKKLWLEYASKNPMSRNCQIPYKYHRSSFEETKNLLVFRVTVFIRNIYFSLLHWVGKISPKLFRKLLIPYLRYYGQIK